TGTRGRMAGAMKLPALLRRRAGPAEVGGIARIDRRTKNLTKRLQPGEVAIIHHSDLDRVSAEALVTSGVSVVVNAVRSVSGRYPNLGPSILLEAGIPLIDDVGEDVFTLVTEGDRLVVDGDRLLDADGAVVTSGTLVTTEVLEEQLEQARAGLSDQIDAFTLNTMTYLREEKELLLEGVGVPEIRTEIEDRHVLIVVRGYNYRGDLDVLRPYISEYKPLLIGVDGGADALLEAGYKPNMIIGDMDSCSDAALQCGAELVVHAYRDGRAPGVERVEALGLSAVVFPVLGTSEDAAMLLADSYGARLMVAVGTHYSLVEFLDKGREGMASSFLTRLRVGSKLVDAKGVSRIYRSQVKGWHLALLVLSGVVALVTALAMTDIGGAVGSLLMARLRDLAYWIKELFT
ncbi:MAG TPA: putative cytokinetic ring protein SteA, partial [Friedmanniella sp.]